MDIDMYDLKPHANESNRAFAYRFLRTKIMTLDLPPGLDLSEKELTEKLHMSRTPIHEALTALRDEWLVDIFPQKGTRVSYIDPILLKEGYSTRLLIEGAIVDEVAGKLTTAESQDLLNRMWNLEAAGNENPDDYVTLIQLDDELHQEMYVIAGKTHTWKSIRGLVSHYDRMRFLDAKYGEYNVQKTFKQHRELIDYLIMGLPAGVTGQEVLTAHLLSFRGNLIEKIERHPEYFPSLVNTGSGTVKISK